jgi:hypothetical protein
MWATCVSTDIVIILCSLCVFTQDDVCNDVIVKVRLKADPERTFALKCLKKSVIVHNGQQEHVFSERNVMLEIHSPFAVR